MLKIDQDNQKRTKKLHSECVRVAVVSLLNPDSPASFMGYISLLQAAVTFLAKEEHR